MHIEKKYQALLQHAHARRLPDVQGLDLCLRTLSLASAIDRDCAARLAPHGLSEGRFVMLFLLEGAPDGLAPNQLADQAGVTRATVTGLLDGLQQQALIERRADAHDGRALRIHLTPAGKQLARTLFDAHGRWISSLFGNLDGNERAQLSQLLDKVAGNVGRSPASA